MNTLFLDQFSEMGGAQRGLLELLPALQELGWQAHALLPGNGPLVRRIRSLNIRVHEIPCGPYRSSGKGPADVLRFAWDLPRQVRAIRDSMDHAAFDLVYVNGPRLLPATALAASHRAPVLFHAHSHIRQRNAARLARWSIRRLDATVVACSKSVASELDPGAVHVIPNGTADFGFQERTFNARRIGMIGRISPEKGQAEFLRAAALLASELPDARFVICGAPMFGAERYSGYVRTLARGLPVDFLGWRDDIDSVLRELDLLVVPSNEEGMGRVVVEAFSAGVPVLAFPVGGIPEAVTDGETGFLTPECTPQALAASIRELVADHPERLRRVALNARRAWEQHYTLAAFQKQITDLMAALVSDWRAARGTATPPRRT